MSSDVETGSTDTTTAPRSARTGSTRALVALLAFVLGFATVPHRVCERDASKWFDGDPRAVDGLAATVARWTTADLTPSSFATGSSRFDGEWLFATYMMSAMGFGQLALARSEVRDANLRRMEHCLDAMLDARVLDFDAKAWGGNALESLDAPPSSAEDRGHVGLLGYSGLALALHRTLRPESRFTKVEERVIATLARRIERSPTHLVETYPGEVYPTDNTSALAALAVHARATNQPPLPALESGLAAIRRIGVDPTTGLLFQAVEVTDGAPRAPARASGTALGTYFLAFADAPLSSALFRALERQQFRTVLGFGGMMEYPAMHRSRGAADIDSGPIVMGFGVSASGFALGASRAHGDRDMFRTIFATAHLFGAPLDEDGMRTYAMGGPIGDAILFAMVTTPRAGSLS